MLFLSCLQFLFLPLLCFSLDIYDEFPKKSVAHCSRKLNYDGQVGCSSNYPNSNGLVLIADNFIYLNKSLTNSDDKIIPVIPLEVFLNINSLSNKQNIAGLVVFSPGFPDYSSIASSSFSENSDCPNGRYNLYNNTDFQCNTKPKWNPPASNFAKISWPFPVVLLSKNETNLWNKIKSCFQNLNQKPVDDTRCIIEIKNYMCGIQSSRICYSRELLLSYRLEQSDSFCSQLGGVNFMLRARKAVSSRAPNSTLVVLSRIDSLSMFDQKASSSLGVLPGVSVLISAAVHLMSLPAFKENKLKKDVLFTFLDNEAFDFTGSQRFIFDLVNKRIATRTGYPFTIESISSIIELSEIGLPKKTTDRNQFYLMSDPNITQQTEEVSASVRKSLHAAAALSQKIKFSNVTDFNKIPLPPTVSLQYILSKFQLMRTPLSHTIIFDHDGPSFFDTKIDSFLDTEWPPSSISDANENLLDLANTLADAIHREVTESNTGMPSTIATVKPDELMHCFVNNPGCDLLRMHLEPQVVDFLISLGGPIPMQTYEAIDGREWRVSHVVARLVMGLTGERLKDCPPSADWGEYTYMYGYFNGSKWCYRSLVETSTSFFFLDDGEVAKPGWVRSRALKNTKHVRLYRSASPIIDWVSLGLGILMTLFTLGIALMIKCRADVIFPKPDETNIPNISHTPLF